MKDRIRKIMETGDMTPAKLADTLDIGRAVISHILNGRNNPSLDVISRILEAFPSVNPDWLLFGTGDMYRNNNNESHTTMKDISKDELDLFSSQTDLFTQKIPDKRLNTSTLNANIVENTDIIRDKTPNDIKPEREKIIYKTLPEKRVLQIIIYYDDNTYEIFQSGGKN